MSSTFGFDCTSYVVVIRCFCLFSVFEKRLWQGINTIVISDQIHFALDGIWFHYHLYDYLYKSL